MSTQQQQQVEIPHDDRLLLRKIIKDEHPFVLNIFQQYKKDKSFTDLQIKLRKFIQNYRYPDKKNQMHDHQNQRHKTNSSQRIYSQNSQPASYKNSLKCSPEKQQQKKKVINLDITELKKRIEHTTSQRSLVFGDKEQIDFIRVDEGKQGSGKKKQISITKINTYLPVKRQNSMRRLENLQKTQQSNKSIATIKQSIQKIKQTPNQKKSDRKYTDFSKITIRKDEKSKENTLQIPKEKDQNNVVPLQDISQNYSYSSNIKSLLSAKLKEYKDPRKNSKILIEQKKTILKTEQVQSECDYQDKYQKKEQTATIIRRPAKPLHKDEYPCSVRLFDHQDFNIPIYLNSEAKLDLRNQGNVATVRNSLRKQNSYNQLKKSLRDSGLQAKRMQIQKGQQNFGRFFEKIKRIMQNKNM